MSAVMYPTHRPLHWRRLEAYVGDTNITDSLLDVKVHPPTPMSPVVDQRVTIVTKGLSVVLLDSLRDGTEITVVIETIGDSPTETVRWTLTGLVSGIEWPSDDAVVETTIRLTE